MKPVKVKELYAALGKIIKDGGANKDIYLVTDDEGNDYHPLWYNTPMTDPKAVREFMQISCSGLSNCFDVDNAVVIG